MIEGKDRDETIRLTADGLRIPLSTAAMMYAMEKGEIPPTGDVRTEDDEAPSIVWSEAHANAAKALKDYLKDSHGNH